jgi:glycine/serine hydroxymethyltransferase
MAQLIARALKNSQDAGILEKVKTDVRELCRQFPVYP